MPPDIRDSVIDFLKKWTARTEITSRQLVLWLGLSLSKYHDWKNRYGCVNEHNGLVPRDFWLESREKEAIISYHDINPLEGYRRLTFMMMDENIVAVSPSSVYRVLKSSGRLQKYGKPSKKGQGFVQPLNPHEHWHIDVSYINICGTFYYLCSILDGCSRYIVHWEIRESMKESEVELIIQRGREKYPEAKPRIISDNGPQFIAKEFKSFIRVCGMTHVRTAPYYPQSNGKIERRHRTIKSNCIRPGTPLTIADARRMVDEFVEHYNHKRLHSSSGYATPWDKLQGREKEIFRARDEKSAGAREARRIKRKESGELNKVAINTKQKSLELAMSAVVQ